jgi:glycosyltransferase involved in cell wall biosynthesis
MGSSGLAAPAAFAAPEDTRAAGAATGKRLKILALCNIYPNPREPGLGPFSRSSLQALAETDEVIVFAPIAPFDYDNPQRRGIGHRSVPHWRRDGNLEVFHPAWLYAPGDRALNGILLAICMGWPLWRLRRHFPFDAIHAHFCHPAGVAAWLLAKLFRCPYIIEFNGNELAHARRPFHRWLMARAVTGAARIIARSDELRNLAVTLGANPKHARMFPNGVDVEVFSPGDQALARRALDLPLARPVILSAGRLVEVKGHQYAIRALGLLRDESSEAELVLAGEAGRGLASCEEDLRQLAARLGVADSVRFLGWVPPATLAQWMSAADVFCLPSLREGCPNAVIEAMACGTPVVASDVGMVRELVRTEDFGFVVAPRDPAALARALKLALHRKWDRVAIARWGQSRSWSDLAREVRAELVAAAAGE